MKAKDKKKMQNVSFKNMDEFWDFLPDKEKEIVIFLREIIINTIPDCVEKLSYNVPYYKRHSNICFLWPACITWGKVKQNNLVLLGFTKGYLMRDELNYLEKGNRKQVFTKGFSSIKEIDIAIIKTYLFEAIEIDKLITKNNK